jgi:hypothetical protein
VTARFNQSRNKNIEAEQEIMFIALVVLVAVLAVANAKMVEVRQNVLVMDEKDRVVGKTEHVFFRDDEIKVNTPPMPGKDNFCSSTRNE